MCVCVLSLVCSLSNYRKSNTWIHTVHEQLCKLAQVSEKLAELRDASMSKWMHFIKDHDKQFGKIITEVVAREEVNTVSFWWPSAPSNNNDDGEVVEEPTIQACPEEGCHQTFPSVHGLVWHLWKDHGLRQPDRNLIDTTVCACCLQQYFTRERE